MFTGLFQLGITMLLAASNGKEQGHRFLCYRFLPIATNLEPLSQPVLGLTAVQGPAWSRCARVGTAGTGTGTVPKRSPCPEAAPPARFEQPQGTRAAPSAQFKQPPVPQPPPQPCPSRSSPRLPELPPPGPI